MNGFGSSGFSFGQQQQPTPPDQQQAPQQQQNSLFANSLGANRTHSFGRPASGCLFGSQTPQTSLGTSAFGQVNGGGLFGSGNTTNSATTTTNTNTFGSTNTNTASTTNPTAALYGTSSGGLFGQSQSNGLFGKPSGGLFGQTQQTQSQQSSDLFGNQPNGLFKPAAGTSNGTTSFGSGLGTNMGTNMGTGLTASIDQASYTLQGVSPSEKLYTSLSAAPVKRGADEARAYEFDSRAPVTRSRIATAKMRPQFTPGSTITGQASLAGPLDVKRHNTLDSTLDDGSETVGEPRKLINSYEKFLRERPTTLIIRAEGRVPVSSLVPGYQASIADAPPTISNTPHASVQPDECDDSMGELTTHDPTAAGERTSVRVRDDTADQKPFQRRANNMAYINVNRQAIEEGYYIYPRLDTLAVMPKQQLSAVEHLVIGRDQYGQIEYPLPVDLSEIANLGDILGTLVVFDAGTVCVYPNDETKASPGHELNLPCTVTIENAWPVDALTRRQITDMEDPRMAKHISKLRQACEARGGEFVTFAAGVWVFKVPHFSTWGLPAEDMVVDDPAEELTYAPKITQPVYDVTNQDADQDPEVSVSDTRLEAKNGIRGVLQFLKHQIDEDGEPLEPNWAQRLAATHSGLSGIGSASLSAASKPTAELSIEDILMPVNNAKDTAASKKEAVANADIEDAQEHVDALRISVLRPYLRRETRQDGDLPLLRTAVKFSDLSVIAPKHDSLWRLLHILDEGESSHDIVRDVAAWLDTKAQTLPVVASHGDPLDAVWLLLARHKVEQASARAVESNNPHLAVLVALLNEKPKLDALKEDANRQLDNWRSTRTLSMIPRSVRLVWELAAGHSFGGQGFTWVEWLGMRLWYSNSTTVRQAVTLLPGSMMSTRDGEDVELAFLQFYADIKQLRSVVRSLDLVTAFLSLQGLITTSTNGTGPQDIATAKCSDSVCHRLAEALDAIEEHVLAVYIALHISDSKLANRVVRNILLHASVNISLPIDFGMPERIMDEARAHQVSKVGEHLAEAEYLVRAGKYNEAHKVIVTTVGPQSVVDNKTSQIVDLLASLDQKKSKVQRWDVGGHVYLLYARARLMGADNYSITALSTACQVAETPNLLSKRAISIIAEWVAAQPYARENLSIESVLRMKFDPAHVRLEALQQASRLLN